MEDVDLTSPFKSPSVSHPLRSQARRSRVDSGSSVSSTDQNNFHSSAASSAGSEDGGGGRDENECPSFARGGESGGASSSSNTTTSEQGEGGGGRVNPFEKDILAGLQRSFWSPSIMEIKETPPQRSWAIEHLSHLFPKDIENSPSTHQNAFPVDAQTEAKAQADINTYFSRDSIVPTPSPMKEKVIKVIGVGGEITTRIKTTSYTQVLHCGQSPIARGGGLGGGGQMLIGGQNNLIKKLKKTQQVPVIERWTQTDISLPVNLPIYVEQLLWQYSQDIDLCGSSGGEAVIYSNSQKSEISSSSTTADNPTENFGVDESSSQGKNSTSLNNSIRRRLELSFGEEDSQGLSQQSGGGQSTSPIPDPFRKNHMVSTPPAPSSSSSSFTTPAAAASASGFPQMNTTTTELEFQLMRCEFTPEGRGASFQGSLAATPGITPIHDEGDEISRLHQHTCSTPRRNTNQNTSKRWVAPPPPCSFSPPPQNSAEAEERESSSISWPGLKNTRSTKVLRRQRVDIGSVERVHHKKRTSASSFDDSQLLHLRGDDDDFSPPAKLHRRHSQNDDNDKDDDGVMSMSVMSDS